MPETATIISAVSIIVVILATVLAVCLFPDNAPDLNLTFPTPESDFNQAVFMLASGKSKNVTYYGNTLPLVNTKKTLKKCYKILSKRVAGGEELNIYETSLYNDYYKISQYATAVSENFGGLDKLPRVNGNLRIYELAQLTVRFHGGQISEEIVKTAFDRYNRVTTLTHAETTNFPLVVRFCLIEYLTAIALRVINQARYVRQAKTDATYGKFHPSLVFSPAYLTAFYAYASENGKIRADKVCQDNGISLVKAIDERAKLDRIYEKLVENTVKSVYALDKILSPKLMQSLDAVNIILEEIPSYRDNSLRTKDYLCARVAMLAKKRKKSETAIASETVGRAFSSGINACEILLPTRKNKWSQRLYILIQILTSVVLTTAVTFILPPPRLLFSIPVSFIVFTTAVKLTDHLVLKLKKERFVPDIDENKVKSSALVTKVCVISTPEDAKRAIFDLKTTACANRDKNLCYALLADLPTAKIKESEIDQKIVTAISNEFATLDQTRFNIFVRKRVKSDDQYHGFERKRGALMALNSLILRNDTAEFLLVLGKSYHHKYVITLDSDTVISRAHRLIGFMEHPLAKFTAVMSVKAVTLPSSRNKTIFSSVFADGDYHDNYAYRHDDAHFALFNEGNFTGKGIYNVEKFDAKLRGFFPRGRILSHDYIEGAVSGCINSPVKVYDETPSNFSAYLSRKLRWTRGDWQLLPYTFNKVKNEQGNTVKNPINPINKWRIALNMNFGLEPLFSLVLLFLSAISGSVILTIFALLPYILPLVLSLKWLTKSKIIPLTLINLITLPATAITLTKGIIVTLFRLISGKNLLSWTISSKDKGKNDYGIEQMLTALILVIINLFTGNNPLVYALASLYAIGLPVIKLTGEKAKNKPLDSKIYGYYYLIAERTWRFYSESVVGSVNFLPPDNYDEREDKGYAYRTSPTNIGMYLTSVYCAYHLGLIDKAVATARIFDTLKTVEKMEKFRGHLYNWYDIKSLAPLPPRYVSFVDSGNFLCALVLVSDIAGDESRAIINKTIKSTDFNFLYDKKVGLCRIGYNTTTASFDGHYDLTASESLISYLICVAFNLLPASTLDNLSTKCYYDCDNTLCSWTGGAFEYLLCPLFFRYEKETMLYSSALNSIKSQKKLAKKCGNKFWGISECQYREKEDNGDYRYKAFGVDAISLCPDTQSTAMSMYGGVLGLGFDKESENLIERYIEENLLGKYGLYESYDHGAIKTYMAHHQGMIMLALTNALKNGLVIKSMRAHPEICSLDTFL
ncbi:MAG: hypothetical protein IJY70_01670, partial [Clostridia bacterium]|nr:hypothetical protein [Clostridia bacterium]